MQKLREGWYRKYADLLGGAPERLPPLRAVNHAIVLIDDTKVYNYYLPRCADAYKTAFLEKLNRYITNGWWEPVTAAQAAPMLCIPKNARDATLRTVVDCRKRNENTVRDVTPLPDQDTICMDVARAKYHSKIDLTDAYEQVRVEPRDVPKTAFATIYGTHVSHVMQIGDCNAPATFQRLMTDIFQEVLGKFVHVYIDDTFVFSDTLEEHEEHLRICFELFKKANLFLKQKKCELYAQAVDCLGYRIDDWGIRISDDKMDRIRNWWTPRNVADIQRFLGLVQYIGQFMPDLTAYTGPLSSLCSNVRPFHWRPLHDKCFEMIKVLACKAPILRPINAALDEPIWLICDASVSGVGAMYGQGKDWRTCRPAGFMSRKFSPAQFSYKTWDREALAILEGFTKWEDKLIGRRVRVVTDHEALGFFKNTHKLSARQVRWMEFLERFDYTITYIEGESNRAADCLSRYYMSDHVGEAHPPSEYANADVRLDPEGGNLPAGRLEEMWAMREVRCPRGRKPTEKPEARAEEAEALEKGSGEQAVPEGSEMTLKELLESEFTEPLRPRVEGVTGIVAGICKGYSEDKLFSKILMDVKAYAAFRVVNGLVFTKTPLGKEVLCIPRALHDKRSIPEIVIEQAHTVLGHFGARKTTDYIRRAFWWPTLVKDVEKYCESCGVCQTSKTRNLPPVGLLHNMPIPTRPWEMVGMDFVGPFPKSHGCDYLWVVICLLTSMVHLIPISVTITARELAFQYLSNIVRLHGMAKAIISDRDSKFTSIFWRELHRLVGTKLRMSTAFHLQTDGATERVIRSASQILRSVVDSDQRDWFYRIPMMEFALNSSLSSTSGFAPFELNGGFMPCMVTELPQLDSRVPVGVRDFVEDAVRNLAAAHDAIIENRAMQTFHANKRRTRENPLKEGDLVYLSTKDLNLPKGRARKLLPKYIGPYRVCEADPETSSYELELPEVLKARRIHPVFHVSRLRPHVPNDDDLFPHREVKVFYDFGLDAEEEWLVDHIVGHRWEGKRIEFEVRWNLGDTTWEPYVHVKELQALDRYLELRGVATWRALLKKAIAMANRERMGTR